MASVPDSVICFPEPLQAFVAAVVRRMGADADVAAEVSQHLVRANLSGHDSHGVIRVAQYVAEAERGDLAPSARPALLRETEVAALVDARRSFGHFATMYATEWCVGRARRHGVAMAAVRTCPHIGRLGEYTERAAADGLIGIVTIGQAGAGVGGVVPFGGRDRFLATNPWSLSAPGQTRAMVFDAATSAIAEGKVRFARAKGTELPPGAIQDREGQPSRSPEDFYAGGAILPLGGTLSGHKGYGLGLASALIGGLAMIGEPAASPIWASGTDTRGRVTGVFLLVIDPGAFGDAGRYHAMVDETLAAAKRVPPAAGQAEVLYPGEPELRSREARRRAGIALPAATWADLSGVAARFGLSLPVHQRVGDPAPQGRA